MNRCLIIDDELPARALIQMYLENLPDFEVVKTLDNAVEGFVYLQNHSVDLLFLDIQMPKMTGLELLKSLQKRPKVVMTTAFREYAAEGFDLDAFDYLVKPISQERFLKPFQNTYTFRRLRNMLNHLNLTMTTPISFLK